MTENSESGGIGFTPKMALCLAAISLAGIDGEFKEEELNKLRKLIQTDETAFLNAFSFYNQHPLEVCIKIISLRLNDEQRKSAFQALNSLAQQNVANNHQNKRIPDGGLHP